MVEVPAYLENGNLDMAACGEPWGLENYACIVQYDLAMTLALELSRLWASYYLHIYYINFKDHKNKKKLVLKPV